MAKVALKTKTTTENKQDDKPAFSFVVPEGAAVGEYHVSNTVIARQFRDYFGQIFEAQGNPLPDHVTSSQIEAVLRNVTITGLSDDTKADEEGNRYTVAQKIVQLYLDAISDAPFMKAGAKEEITQVAIARGVSTQAIAFHYGEQVPDFMVSYTHDTIEAMRKADAGPTAMAWMFLGRTGNKEQDEKLKAVFNDKFWNECPPMGSVWKPGNEKGNHAPKGYRLPNDSDESHGPIYNGPWDKYTVENKNPPPEVIQHDWVGEFCSERIAVNQFELSRLCSKLAENVTPDRKDFNKVSDADWKRLLARKGEKIELQQDAGDYAWEFQKLVRITRDGLKIAQKVRAIKERFGFDVVLTARHVDPTVSFADACRKKKTFVLYEYRANADGGTPIAHPFGPYEMSKIRGIEPTDQPANETGKEPATSAAKLMAPKLRAGKGKGTPTASAPTAGTTVGNEAKVSTVEDLARVMSSTASYLASDGKWEMIMARVRQPEHGGPLAYALIYIHDAIEADPERAKALRAIGNKWDREQLANAADKADAANKAA